MDYNWLGVVSISEDLPAEIKEMVNQKIDELKEKAENEFEEFLDENKLENIMGVIFKKEPTITENFVRQVAWVCQNVPL